MSWKSSPETDEDLIASRDFIAADNEQAARDSLDAAFETFDLLGNFPEMGTLAHFQHQGLQGVRYFVLPPPFNRWLIFYRSTDQGVDIQRVLYGNINWRQEPQRFF